MVLTAAALQSRRIELTKVSKELAYSQYFTRKGFGSAMPFNAERGYRNVLVRNMRFNHLLFSNISDLRFRSKHKFAEKLVKEVDSNRKTDILGRSKLFNKVSAWLGNDGLDDIIDNEKAKHESFCQTNQNEDLGISLACKQFPAITLGDSPIVNLYDGDKYSSWDEVLLVEHLCKELLSRATGSNWDNEDGLYRSLGSLYPKVAKGGSTILDQVAPGSSSMGSPSSNMEEASRLESQFIADELKVYPKVAKGGSTIPDQIASDSSEGSSQSLKSEEPPRLESQSIADELKVYPKVEKDGSTILDPVASDSSSRSSPSFNMDETSRLEYQSIADELKVYLKVAKGSSTILEQAASDSSSLVSPSINVEETSRLKSQSITDESFNITSTVEVQESATSIMPLLDTTVKGIPGLSKKLAQQLENCGFHTLRQLLHHFPRTYADMQNAHVGICDGQYMIFVGEILSSRGIKASYSVSFLELVVACEVAKEEPSSAYIFNDADHKRKKTIYLNLKQFFRGARFTSTPFLKGMAERYNKGDAVCVSGKVRGTRDEDHYEMREYHIDILQDGEDSSIYVEGKLYPIHPSKGALRATVLRNAISRALKMLPVNFDPIPRDITQEFGLPCLRDAYVGIHQPKNLEEADLARKRLIFDEFFYLQLGRLFKMLEGLGTGIERDGLLDRYRKPEQNTTFIEEWSPLTKTLLDTLPYALTPSQLNAVSEIIWDLKRPVPMNRLLQGDVGCGKTVVAFLACMEVIGCGYQAAFMVPTELLAVQHYEHCLDLLEKVAVDCKPSVALLTKSTPSKLSRSIRKGLQTGEISLVIGTHSLIAEKVEFSALRIAIIDEQHRFGVIQRGLFNSKLYNPSIIPKEGSSNSDDSKGILQMAPHVLAMSATPIPRSLALALYGDISLTQITDLPPGRLPVETFSTLGNEDGIEMVYQMMLDELGTGGKVYVVYCAIDLSEQLPQLRAVSADFKTISSRFRGYSCGLLHGKMKSDEKDNALRRFRSGETNILLATQVIETGVDVPDASMMVVMNAERLGLAQLHQLRGRVGRGERKSKCVLLSSTAHGLNRLKVLEYSSDGFHLAGMDLIHRGPGDLLGKKQSGHLPEFPVARLEIDGSIIQDAQRATLKILQSSHDLQKFKGLRAELNMRQPLCTLGD